MIPVPMYGDDVGTPGEQIARVADRVCLAGVNIFFYKCRKKTHSLLKVLHFKEGLKAFLSGMIKSSRIIAPAWFAVLRSASH